MSTPQVLSFAQEQLHASRTTAEIVDDLIRHFQVNISLRILKMWIKTHALERTPAEPALVRRGNATD